MQVFYVYICIMVSIYAIGIIDTIGTIATFYYHGRSIYNFGL